MQLIKTCEEGASSCDTPLPPPMHCDPVDSAWDSTSTASISTSYTSGSGEVVKNKSPPSLDGEDIFERDEGHQTDTENGSEIDTNVKRKQAVCESQNNVSYKYLTLPRLPLWIMDEISEAKQNPDFQVGDRAKRTVVQIMYFLMTSVQKNPKRVDVRPLFQKLVAEYPELGNRNEVHPRQPWDTLLDRAMQKHQDTPDKRSASARRQLLNAASVCPADVQKYENLMVAIDREFEKTNRNPIKLDEMQVSSFEPRRRDMYERDMPVQELTSKYKFFTYERGIMLECELLLKIKMPNNLNLIITESKVESTKKLIKMKAGTCDAFLNNSAMYQQLSCGFPGESSIVSFVILLTEFTKENFQLFRAHTEAEGGTDMCPLISVDKEDNLFVVAEKQIVCSCNTISSALLTCLSAYFAFDMQYPKVGHKALETLEHILGFKKENVDLTTNKQQKRRKSSARTTSSKIMEKLKW